jgi:integrase
MARTVRDSNLETRTARGRLKSRKKPYWRSIDRGLHLGYFKGARAGRWLLRSYVGAGRYQEMTLGTADDVQDADGGEVLSYSQAQARARSLAAARRKGEAADGPFTVADAMHDYLAWIEQHRKATTAREWRYVAQAHVVPALGNHEVVSLTTAQLRRWHEQLAAQPARLRSRRGAPPKRREAPTDTDQARARRATANRILTVLKAALNHAHHEGKVSNADVWRSVKPFRGADAARVRYLQRDECVRLLNACPPDFRRLVRGALVSGARYGELCRADVRDFNPDSASLLVRESKGGKPRHIPLDDEGAAFFTSVTAGRRPTDPLFVRADGGRWGKSHQRRPLLEACKAAKIEPAIGFHILRHSWASLRIMAGLPLMVAAQVLGHSDTRMVERHYSHLAPSFVRDAVRATAINLGSHDSDIVPLAR